MIETKQIEKSNKLICSNCGKEGSIELIIGDNKELYLCNTCIQELQSKLNKYNTFKVYSIAENDKYIALLVNGSVVDHHNKVSLKGDSHQANIIADWNWTMKRLKFNKVEPQPNWDFPILFPGLY